MLLPKVKCESWIYYHAFKWSAFNLAVTLRDIASVTIVLALDLSGHFQQKILYLF